MNELSDAGFMTQSVLCIALQTVVHNFVHALLATAVEYVWKRHMWSIACESFAALLLLFFLHKVIPDDCLQCQAKTANHDELKTVLLTFT